MYHISLISPPSNLSDQSSCTACCIFQFMHHRNNKIPKIPNDYRVDSEKAVCRLHRLHMSFSPTLQYAPDFTDFPLSVDYIHTERSGTTRSHHVDILFLCLISLTYGLASQHVPRNLYYMPPFIECLLHVEQVAPDRLIRTIGFDSSNWIICSIILLLTQRWQPPAKVFLFQDNSHYLGETHTIHLTAALQDPSSHKILTQMQGQQQSVVETLLDKDFLFQQPSLLVTVPRMTTTYRKIPPVVQIAPQRLPGIRPAPSKSLLLHPAFNFSSRLRPTCGPPIPAIRYEHHKSLLLNPAFHSPAKVSAPQPGRITAADNLSSSDLSEIPETDDDEQRRRVSDPPPPHSISSTIDVLYYFIARAPHVPPAKMLKSIQLEGKDLVNFLSCITFRHCLARVATQQKPHAPRILKTYRSSHLISGAASSLLFVKKLPAQIRQFPSCPTLGMQIENATPPAPNCATNASHQPCRKPKKPAPLQNLGHDSTASSGQKTLVPLHDASLSIRHTYTSFGSSGSDTKPSPAPRMSSLDRATSHVPPANKITLRVPPAARSRKLESNLNGSSAPGRTSAPGKCTTPIPPANKATRNMPAALSTRKLEPLLDAEPPPAPSRTSARDKASSSIPLINKITPMMPAVSSSSSRQALEPKLDVKDRLAPRSTSASGGSITPAQEANFAVTTTSAAPSSRQTRPHVLSPERKPDPRCLCHASPTPTPLIDISPLTAIASPPASRRALECLVEPTLQAGSPLLVPTKHDTHSIHPPIEPPIESPLPTSVPLPKSYLISPTIIGCHSQQEGSDLIILSPTDYLGQSSPSIQSLSPKQELVASLRFETHCLYPFEQAFMILYIKTPSTITPLKIWSA
ncbi:hypothetical protein VP01_2362g2 [Puccinia sorghi]|uniref:Uncharacterized protein n=1 Tax=Puccinia sorghi TaxID=27349 RepID=A0A0L6V7B8_9BASI|nr:hypothetical protein VP01_2362g2 [Puccinia sorghi]